MPLPFRDKMVVNTKMPRTLVRRLDAFASKLSAETPGLEVNRSEAILVLLTFALDAKGIEAPAEDAPLAGPLDAGQNTKAPRERSREKGGKPARKP